MNTPAEPALLLFDLGGVLLESSAHQRLCHLTGVDITLDDYRERWLRSAAVCRFESGRCTPREFADEFIREWRLELDHDAFVQEFCAWPLDFYTGARETLASLRQRYRIACLSNSNELHWQRFQRFEGIFDIALSSHELGVLKPEADAFTRALEICDVAPGAVLFFDDSRSNVASAAALGIRAFHVEGFDDLRRVLKAEGVLAR